MIQNNTTLLVCNEGKLNYPILRVFWGVFLLSTSLYFIYDFYVNSANKWEFVYVTAISSSILYLYYDRKRFFTVTYIFIALQLVGITLAIAPFIYFNIGNLDLKFSIYINSLGIIIFIGFITLLYRKNFAKIHYKEFFQFPAWKRFFLVNKHIFLFTLPFVLLVMIVSGGWRSYFGLADSGFDRIASLKGLGPLMIFSTINVISGAFWSVGLLIKKKWFSALLLILMFIVLNGFTHGRGNLIQVVMMLVLFSGLLYGFKYKSIFVVFFIGMFIVLLKITRGGKGSDETSSIVTLFLHFSGDFDSIVNTSHLLKYIDSNGFSGFYHIWSNLLVYIPRSIYPDKPHYIGGLYLNDLVFPGLYLGAAGGTGYSFGIIGTLYAANGMFSFFLAIMIVVAMLLYFERSLIAWASRPIPGIFIVAYIMLIGNVVVLYRDGMYAFMNVAFYTSLYFVLYKIIGSRYKLG